MEAEALRLGQQTLARTPRFEPHAVDDVLDPTGTRLRKERESEGTEAIAAGTQAYNDLDIQAALGFFERAQKALEQTDLTRTFGLLSRAQVMKVASLVGNGNTFLVDSEIDRVLALNARAQFSANYFPPEWLAKAERQRKASLAGGKGRLEVRTLPAGAQVYLNGQYRGRSPLTVTGLMRPEQYVTVKAPGYLLEQRRIFEPQLEWTLRRAPDAQALQTLQTALGEEKQRGQERAAQTFGKNAALDTVMVGLLEAGPEEGTLKATGFRVVVKDGRVASEKIETLREGDGFEAALDSWVSALVSQELAPGMRSSREKSSSRWTRHTTGYLLLGVGAALVGGGALSLVKGQSARRREAALPFDPSSTLRRQGDTLLGLALGLGVVGMGGAVLGGYLALAPEPQSPAPRRLAPVPVVAPEPSSHRVEPVPAKAKNQETDRKTSDDAQRLKADEDRKRTDEANVRRVEDERHRQEAARQRALELQAEALKRKAVDAKKASDTQKKKEEGDDLRNY